MNDRVSNEKKNLNRLAGEFLVASRLTQRGYMITLQWGNTISYDILVFDKKGKVAYIEVKSSALYHRRWVLQKKYAHPETDAIPLEKRFVCCVDLSRHGCEPTVYVLPAAIVARGLHYFYTGRFSKSASYRLSLDDRPQGRTKDPTVASVGEYIRAEEFLEAYHILGIDPIVQ